MSEIRKMVFQYEVYPDWTEPKGFLPDDKRAHACMYYYMLAQQMKQKVGKSTEDQIIYEGELWLDNHYESQARTVALIYGLESPAEFMKFWEYVEQQIALIGWPAPCEEMKRAYTPRNPT